MDIISPHQLQQYEDILREISSEFEKSEQLKKDIRQTEDTITGLKLSLFPCQQKISHVNVKIFSRVTDILNLYRCDLNYYDLEILSKNDSCRYFLIEVILTKCLLVKLLESECTWKLHINICTDFISYVKVIPLLNKSSILEVIPVRCESFESLVDTSLFYYSGGEWNIIDLHSVNVDVSHYFESYKEEATTSVLEHFKNLTKMYNQNVRLPCILTPIQLQSQFKCNFDSQSFVATLIKNSYHRLNLESFSEVGSVIDLQFCINGNKAAMLYNKNTHVLKLRCSSSEMLFLKKFLLEDCVYNQQDFKNRLKKLKNKKNDITDMDFNEMLSLYQEVRKLWL